MTISRRRLLQTALGGGAATAAGALLPPTAAAATAGSGQVPFYGMHQAGITTRPQACLVLAAFDLQSASRSAVALMLRSWTDAAARMTAGLTASASQGSPAAPPPDTGEARGAGPQHLTVTVGFGPGFFDTLRITARRPPGLAPLPPMPGDQLDPAWCGGDLVVQACADSEVVALHAVRQLMRLGAPLVTPRWMQRAFGLAARAPQADRTPRNLLGFKDGTANPRPASEALDAAVFIAAPDTPRWARGGTYLAVRRVLTDLAKWDADTLDDQQRAIGRFKASGAPLTGGDEYTRPDFRAQQNGRPVIPRRAHIRAAHPRAGEPPMLRRGGSFDDGLNADGTLAAGALFLAFVRDLDTQFVPALTRVMTGDDLTRHYTTHVGSAVFLVPPGARHGGWIGQTLLG